MAALECNLCEGERHFTVRTEDAGSPTEKTEFVQDFSALIHQVVRHMADEHGWILPDARDVADAVVYEHDYQDEAWGKALLLYMRAISELSTWKLNRPEYLYDSAVTVYPETPETGFDDAIVITR